MLDTSRPTIRFGLFEVDTESGDLRKAGRRVALQQQPFRVLVRLLERPGRLVTREELRAELWPADTFVDFEQGLNAAIKRLREALGDPADAPRYVETLPRRGYRFIAPVTPPVAAADLYVRPQETPEPGGIRAWRRAWSGISGVLALLAVALAAAVLLALGLIAAWAPLARGSSPVVRSEVSVQPAETLNAGGIASRWILTPGGSRTALTWTPDGRSLVFVGRRGSVQQLYVRTLDAPEARPLAGTEGAQVPAVSADGQWVAFWAQAALKKVPLAGGPVMELVSGIDSPPSGLVWDGSGRVFFGQHEGIWQIPPRGAPTPVTTLTEAEGTQVPSSLLPGEREILYTARKPSWKWGDEEVVALDLATGRRKVLLRDAADARYVPTGHLVFLRRGVLFGVPFDARRVEVGGPPVPLIDGVAQSLTAGNSRDLTGAGQFSVAASGTLAWISGPVAPGRESVLVSVDRRGRISPLGSPVRDYAPVVRVSPDGTRLLVGTRTLTELGIWLYDFGRMKLTPLRVDTAVLHGGGGALWSPDGRQVLFGSTDGGRTLNRSVAADGSAPPETLGSFLDADAGEGAAEILFEPSSWAPGGQLLGVVDLDHGRLAVATFENGTAHVKRLWRTAESMYWPAVSPDGRWLVYGSNASGRFEIYVQPYPGPGARTVVSAEGGGGPAWHPSGRELFYVTSADPSGTRRMMAVDFEPGMPPRLGTPRPLFDLDATHLAVSCIPVRCYDVSPDGLRFYAVQTPTPPSPPVVTHINLVQNWFEELQANVPAK